MASWSLCDCQGPKNSSNSTAFPGKPAGGCLELEQMELVIPKVPSGDCDGNILFSHKTISILSDLAILSTCSLDQISCSLG